MLEVRAKRGLLGCGRDPAKVPGGDATLREGEAGLLRLWWCRGWCSCTVMPSWAASASCLGFSPETCGACKSLRRATPEALAPACVRECTREQVCEHGCADVHTCVCSRARLCMCKQERVLALAYLALQRWTAWSLDAAGAGVETSIVRTVLRSWCGQGLRRTFQWLASGTADQHRLCQARHPDHGAAAGLQGCPADASGPAARVCYAKADTAGAGKSVHHDQRRPA
jgi:hypothetical protein